MSGICFEKTMKRTFIALINVYQICFTLIEKVWSRFSVDPLGGSAGSKRAVAAELGLVSLG